MTNQPIYLDYAAATPVALEVYAAMQPYFSDLFYNPSANYLAAMQVKKDLEKARSNVALVLGVRPIEITFTAGGSEANNLAIRGIMQQFPGKHLVVSAIEHDSVLAPAKAYNHSLASVDKNGQVDPAVVQSFITDETVLVSVMLANNEVGTIQQIHKISQIVAAIRASRKKTGNTLPLYIHTDACQAALYLDLHASRLGVDMMTLNGGKMYGPKQSGMLYVKSGTQLQPQILGGGQERGRRSGTENIAFAVGFSVALQHAQAGRQAESKRLKDLQEYFMTELLQSIPTATINGSLKHRLPNNIHMTIPGIDNETVLFALDELGIMAAAGSACSASSDEPSHVLRAMAINDQAAQSSLRFTMGKTTVQADISRTISSIVAVVAR